jgi:hypothetical protein
MVKIVKRVMRVTDDQKAALQKIERRRKPKEAELVVWDLENKIEIAAAEAVFMADRFSYAQREMDRLANVLMEALREIRRLKNAEPAE